MRAALGTLVLLSLIGIALSKSIYVLDPILPGEKEPLAARFIKCPNNRWILYQLGSTRSYITDGTSNGTFLFNLPGAITEKHYQLSRGRYADNGAINGQYGMY
jgi:hypothetical protein